MPVRAAPMTAPIAPISSSICMKRPPTMGNLRERNSAISEEGVMGYPPKNLHPAATAPSAHASLPCIIRTVSFGFFAIAFSSSYTK